MTTAPTLRPYQLEAHAALKAELAVGRNRLLIKSATGTGKTVWLAALPTELAGWLGQFPEKERRILIIAHREEILDQTVAKLQAANKDLVVMVEQADRVASPYSDVVVASIQSLAASKFRRLDRLMSRMTFRIVIVDECHHAAAATYRGTLARLGFLPTEKLLDADDDIEAASWSDVSQMEAALAEWDDVAPKDRLLVGLTATPNRSDAIGLNCVFQTIAYDYPIRKAVSDGWLVPLVPYVVESAESLDGVRTVAGDFNQGQLAKAVNTPARNRIAVKAWHDYAKDRPTLAFTVDVAHANDLAEAFRAVGVRAVALSGETPKDVRRGILRDFSTGQLDVVTNCMVLTEGTDLPRTSCILHAKPTKSATLYEQMTGRGLRLFEGKTDCRIIDVVDIARKHSLQTVPQLYGLPIGLLGSGKKTLDDMADEWDALVADNPSIEQLLVNKRLTLEQIKLKVASFNVWAIPDLGEFGHAVTLKWAKSAEDAYRLDYPWADGKETLEVRRDMLGHWEIVVTIKPADDKLPRRQRTLANNIVSREEAAKTAEAFIYDQRRTVVGMKNKDAPWRLRPASQKQILALQKFKVPFRKGVTAGEASDLLDLAFSKKKRNQGGSSWARQFGSR